VKVVVVVVVVHQGLERVENDEGLEVHEEGVTTKDVRVTTKDVHPDEGGVTTEVGVQRWWWSEPPRQHQNHCLHTNVSLGQQSSLLCHLRLMSLFQPLRPQWRRLSSLPLVAAVTVVVVVVAQWWSWERESERRPSFSSSFQSML
jgi:hypothetical protein